MVRSYTRTAATATAGLLVACAPGRIAWPTGEDDLRTALYITSPYQTTQHVRLLLSNADLDCKVPSPDDISDVAELSAATEAMLFGLCREDARHVVIDLYRPRGGVGEGFYTGETNLEPGGLDAPDYAARAWYFGIDEAQARSGDDLVQDYDLVAWESEVLGDGGTVHVTRHGEDRVAGSFGFPEAHISGQFDARFCNGEGTDGTDGTMFGLLEGMALDDLAGLELFCNTELE